MPDAIAGMAKVQVGRVFPPALALCLQIGFDFTPSGRQKRPDEMLCFVGRSNARQSACAGTAQDSHQHGFRLIVQRMGRGDLVSFPLLD